MDDEEVENDWGEMVAVDDLHANCWDFHEEFEIPVEEEEEDEADEDSDEMDNSW